MKADDPPNNGAIDEIAGAEVKAIINSSDENGIRVALALFEESADKTELIPTLLGHLPSKSAKYIRKFSDGALKDLGSKGDEAIVLANRLQRPTQVKAMGILDRAGYLTRRSKIVDINKLESLITNAKFESSGFTEDLLEAILKGNRQATNAAVGLDELMLLGTKFENVGHVAADMQKALSFKTRSLFFNEIYNNKY